MARITFTAVLPNGETATRTSTVKHYAAVVAVAPVGTDNWTVADWYEDAEHAEGIVRGTDVRYWPTEVNAKVVTAEITKVVGKTTDPIVAAAKARLAKAQDINATELWGADLLADVAEAVAEPIISDADIAATSDALGALLTEGTKLVADALAEAREEIAQAEVNEAVAAAKADTAPPAKMSLAQKRELGSGVHDRIRSVLDRLPAGIDPAEAAAAVETWLLYIPKNRTEESAGMTPDQKRELGSAVRALAEEALSELPVGVAPASALAQLDTWFTYIPQSK
jgi:hypothetical protein